MNISMLCIGTRGDVQPYVALGKGLKAAGHAVRLATHCNFEQLVVSHGLEFAPIAGDPEAIAIEWSKEMKNSGKGTGLAFLRELARASQPRMQETFSDGLAACRGTDVVMASPLGILIGFHLAEKLGVPLVRTTYLPGVPTSQFPALPLPRLLRVGPVNRSTYTILRELVWLMIRKPTNRVRSSLLELPPCSWRDPYASLDRRKQLMLLAFSPTVWPPARDWGDWVRTTGYWFLDRPEEWQPSADLVAFIESGPPPVYVGFGSTPSLDPELTAQVVVRALKQTGCRAVIGTGWNGMKNVADSHELHVVEEVPFDWLFPQMAAVVHHGGMGTTALALRAGVPSVIVPSIADQPFWGRRVAALGAGPRPIPRQELTEERLAAAIRQAVGDAEMRRRARSIGYQIRRENGVARAVEAFNEFFGVEPVRAIELVAAGARTPDLTALRQRGAMS